MRTRRDRGSRSERQTLACLLHQNRVRIDDNHCSNDCPFYKESLASRREQKIAKRKRESICKRDLQETRDREQWSRLRNVYIF